MLADDIETLAGIRTPSEENSPSTPGFFPPSIVNTLQKMRHHEVQLSGEIEGVVHLDVGNMPAPSPLDS